MHDPSDLDRELQRHALGLRGLAKELVRDAHAAEDIAQDTLCRAASRRDLQPGPLGGWLYRTAVNFARQWRRRSMRERARFEALPPPAHQAATDELLSRAETLRAVTDAVLSLDEPYQSTVLMRYFEDLPPRTIAARTHCNLATVKSRLARGLALLRQRLDRQCRGDRDRWRLALVGAFGLPSAAAAAAGVTLSTGIWLMSTASKTLAAAGLLFAGGLLVFTFGKDPAPPQVSVADSSAPRQVNAATGDGKGNASPITREEVEVDTAAAPDWLTHAFLFELEVRLLDHYGLPVAGRTVDLAPPGCTFDQLDGATNADGIAKLRWPSRLPTGEVTVRDMFGVMHKVALQHGVPRRITLGHELRAMGGSYRVSLRHSGNLELSGKPTVISGIPIVARLFDNADRNTAKHDARMHPFAEFSCHSAPAAVKVVTESFSTSVSFWGNLELTSYATKGKANDTPQSRPAITGTVFGEDGAIAAKVPVFLMGEGPQPIAETASDERGEFRFDELQPGTFTVRAGGDAAGLGTAEAITTTGTTPVTVNLRRETTLRGFVRTADGQPLKGARVQWFAQDGTWWDATKTDADGAFVFANLPNAQGRVLAFPVNHESRLPIASADNVLANAGELLLTHDPSTLVSLRFELTVPEDNDRNTTIARLWNDDLGLGIEMQRPEVGKPWTADGLVPGWYRGQVFVPGCGWIDLGRHWIDRGTCDLGVVMPPPGCRVEIRAAAQPADAPPLPRGGLELYAIRGDLDLILDTGMLERDSNLLLPVGEYAIACRDAQGAVTFHRFRTTPGDVTIVELPRY